MKNSLHKNRPLQVGDLCITVNSDHPACNNGDLVTIIKIDHSRNDRREGPVPYLIRRIDGLPHISTVTWGTGVQQWAKGIDAWCAAHKLKRVEGEPEINESDAACEARSPSLPA